MTTSKCKHCGRDIVKHFIYDYWFHSGHLGCGCAEPIDGTEKPVDERIAETKNLYGITDSLVFDLQALIDRFILENPHLWVENIDITYRNDMSGKKIAPKIKVTIEVN